MKMGSKLRLFGLGLLGTLGLGYVAKSIDFESDNSQGCNLEEKLEEPISRFKMDTDRLNTINPEYRLTEEELIFLTRMIYFEDGSFAKHLRKDLSKDAIQKSNEAIASVLLNRYKLDKNLNSNKFHKNGSNGSLITFAKFPYAFSCLNDQKDFFNLENFYDENGNLSLKSKGLSQEYLDIAYSALVRVLSGEVDDPTEGALYYKTKELGKSGKIVWHGTEAFWLNGSSCKRDWITDITNHQYYGVDCLVE